MLTPDQVPGHIELIGGQLRARAQTLHPEGRQTLTDPHQRPLPRIGVVGELMIGAAAVF